VAEPPVPPLEAAVPPDPAWALVAAAIIPTTARMTAHRAIRSGRRTYLGSGRRRRYSLVARELGGPSYIRSFVAYGVS
jgi:hypothetical protein